MRVAFTVDFEPDCPPYMQSTFRGVTEGGPLLLDILRRRGIPATYFVTGAVAERYPAAVDALLADGHELGSHGVTHAPFDTMTPDVARREIEESARTLRTFAPVVSFRAPYLRFPPGFLPFLEESGFRVDSSTARYKPWKRTRGPASAITRVPASVTSSLLRLPRALRDPVLLGLRDPVVIFVHPWELVDLRHEPLRLDCRFRTGDSAARAIDDVIRLFQRRGSSFVLMRDIGRA